MKNRKSLRIFTVLLVLLMTATMVQAQTKDESQAKAEHQKQMQEKEMQMKQMEMQLKKQQLEQEKKLVELEEEHERQARRVRSSARASSGSRERSVIYASPELSDEGAYFIHSYGQENQSQLTLRNSFSGESISSSGDFEVEESTRKIRFSVNGKVRHGDINIKVIYPGGKVFKDLNINSSAQITFSQSLTIKEDEKKKYIGTWKYEVKANKAEGSYMLSIMTQ